MSEFPELLADHLAGLDEFRERGASEDSIRDLFLQFLRGAFPRLTHAGPILLEKHIPGLRVRGGFADALYGDLIFEFKRRLDDQSRADGLEELHRYVANQDHPERYFGILCDGATLEVYALRGDTLRAVDQLILAVDRTPEAKVWLDCYLFHEKRLAPSAEDVALRFGERSPTFWRSLRILEDLWGQVGPSPGVQTKFAEWQSLLSIVYGSVVGDHELFLRHTYLALFARVLAFVTLEQMAPKVDQFAGILFGQTFEEMGFKNFVTDDFFTWVDTPRSVQPAHSLLRALATRVTIAYDLSAIREDLLKELYQELIDPETRHDLGEFYTPDWLAELTLRKAGFPGDAAPPGAHPSLLDPACGSGTFLFVAVRLLRQAGLKGQALVEFCAAHLAGLDVHPLAVTIAKTNLLLALGADLRRYRRRFALPIFMADSLLSADSETTHPEIEIKVDVDELAHRSGKPKVGKLPSAFGIPAALADQPDALYAALEALLEFASSDLDDAGADEGLVLRLKEARVPDAQLHQWRANLDLMRWLLQFPATDSVWRFILTNACQPELFARRKFDYVVGNPPWLSYRYVKRRDYQRRLRGLALELGVLGKRAAHLITQMELATVFFAFCADRYLRQGGTLAFVMPRSVLTGAKQHAQFRRRFIAQSHLLIDCEKVEPLFRVPACVVIWERPGPARGPAVAAAGASVAIIAPEGLLPSRNMSLGDAERHLRTAEAEYVLQAAQEGSPYWGEVTQGATVVPRSFWFVHPPPIARIVDQVRPQLETDSSLERRAKKPWKGIRLSGSVEAEFLYATLLSDEMVPFGWRRFSLVALPVVEDPAGGVRLLDVDGAVRRGRMGMADWLRQAEAEWERHRKSDVALVRYVNWQGKLTRQRPKGVVKLLYNKSGTHLCACVVDARRVATWTVHDLPVRGFIADHVTYWLETSSLDEAHYLCAVLNAPVIDAAIKPYQTKGAFGAIAGKGERDIHRRPFEVVPIPSFRAEDEPQRELARLSRRCHGIIRRAVCGAEETWLQRPVGRLRSELRGDLLKAELAEIDELAKGILE